MINDDGDDGDDDDDEDDDDDDNAYKHVHTCMCVYTSQPNSGGEPASGASATIPLPRSRWISASSLLARPEVAQQAAGGAAFPPMRATGASSGEPERVLHPRTSREPCEALYPWNSLVATPRGESVRTLRPRAPHVTLIENTAKTNCL